MTLFRFVSQETAKLGRSDARWQANNDYRVNCEDCIIVTSRDLRNSAWNRAWPRSAQWTAKLTRSSFKISSRSGTTCTLQCAPLPKWAASRLQAWAMATRTGQRRAMRGRRGEFGENSLRCNELLPPENSSRIGPARARKNAFHIHDFIVDFTA